MNILVCMWYIYVLIPLLIIIFIKWNYIKTLFSIPGIKYAPISGIQDRMPDSIQDRISDTVLDTVPTITVFAINDNGIFDLADANGKILNIGFGPNPKVYINLLDQSENDVEKNGDTYSSNVGIKTYEIGGRKYNVDFTRL